MSIRVHQGVAMLIVGCLGIVLGRWSVESGGGRFSATDMEAGVAEALAAESFRDRLVLLSRLVEGMDASNARGAGAALAERVSAADNNDIRLLLSAWSEFDPRAAFDAVMSWPLESKRVVGAGVVAYEWSRRGGALEVREYLKDLGQVDVQSAAHRGLVQGWAQSSDVGELTEFVSSEKNPATREQLTEILVNSMLATGGVEAVMDWADSVASDTQNQYKRMAFRKALRQVGNRDPEVAARWYAAQAGEPYAARMIPVIAGEWAEHDPPAALEWILSQPASNERDIALQRWITRWTSNDHRAALEWMEAADLKGPLADLPRHFVGALLPNHPAEAARWVDRIVEEEVRVRAAQEVGLVWRQTDPATASRWLSDRGVDPATIDARRLPRLRRMRPSPVGSSPAGQAEVAGKPTGESQTP